jgi:murein L,D-transpeptidase YafK
MRLLLAGTTSGLVVLAGAPLGVGAQVLLGKPAVRVDTGTTRRTGPAVQNQAEIQKYQRVLEARLEKRFELKKLFRERGVTYPAAEVFMRIFKRERLLEVWARDAQQDKFVLLKSYSICALSGRLGPKRAQGDGQTPEGSYFIDGMNPQSGFHLSLHIDYPNRSDQILSDHEKLGGDIFIHGGCRTEGCLAVTDDAIKELYWLAVEARKVGQQRIPVHIFPTRMTDAALNELARVLNRDVELNQFWANLRPMYDYFETTHKLPLVSIDDRGRYRVQPQIGRPAVLSSADSVRPAMRGN